ncbi:hypothetical protein RJ639_039852, partial [Escallonia herrerae]
MGDYCERSKRDWEAASGAEWIPEQQASPGLIYFHHMCPNFRPNIPPAPIPLPPPPPPPPPDLRSPNPIYRPAPLIPNVEHLRPNSVSLSKPMNVGRGEIGWSRNLGSGRGNWPRLWDGEYNVQVENQRLDQHGYEYRPNMSFPYDSNARVWPLPNVVQRSQQFQQPSSSSMMEPPSNQSYSGNNYTNLWPGEEKMVGMKRPYPFSVDNAPGPSFNSKFPPVYVSPISGPHESAPCTNGGSINIEPANPVLREHPLSPSSMSEPNQGNVTKENGGLHGEFLTLAPPATAQPHSSSKQKYLSPYLSQLSRELPEFDSLPSQGITEDRTRSPGLGGYTEQPFFCFFPLAKTQNDRAATPTSNNGDAAE